MPSSGCNYFTVTVNGKTMNMDKDDVFRAAARSVHEFCNVDGESGRSIMPFPHDPHFVPEAAKYEKLSAAERVQQVQSNLGDLEIVTLEAAIVATTGNTLEKSGFFEMLRWWALSNYSMDGLYNLTEGYKVAVGQSEFARAFFDEALATGNLSYSFGTHITSIIDYGNIAVLSSRSGNQNFAGKRVICTVPLNILHELEFNPTLPKAKMDASHQGHVNFCSKYHIEAKGTDLRSWYAIAPPESRLISILGDGLTPAGNTHLVDFGHDSPVQGHEEGRDAIAMTKMIHDMEIEKVVWHNWVTDPLSRGAWAMFPPNFSFKYLQALRERHGNILFASADWALGWRGFIDGAIEDGTRAAKETLADLGYPRRVASSL